MDECVSPAGRASLDPQETTVDRVDADRFSSGAPAPLVFIPERDWPMRFRSSWAEWQSPTVFEEVRRHGRWSTERQRVYDALRKSGAAERRIEAFACCGGNAWVEGSPDNGKIRVRCQSCHDRFCEPCSRTRRNTIRENLAAFIKGRSVRMVTLTLRHSAAPLRDQISLLLESFRRLRSSSLWKARVEGGLAVVEVKRAKGGKAWHPHLHVIAEGKYLPTDVLSEAWKQASKGSFIVHVTLPKSHQDVLDYASKYATKGVNTRDIEEEEHLSEAMAALAGRRLVTTFGTWHGLALNAKPEPSPGTWATLTRLDSIATAAAAGNALARAWKDWLGRGPAKPGEQRSRPPWPKNWIMIAAAKAKSGLIPASNDPPEGPAPDLFGGSGPRTGMVDA